MSISNSDDSYQPDKGVDLDSGSEEPLGGRRTESPKLPIKRDFNINPGLAALRLEMEVAIRDIRSEFKREFFQIRRFTPDNRFFNNERIFFLLFQILLACVIYFSIKC